MKPTEIRERMVNRSLADLDIVWKELSAHAKVGTGALRFSYTRQHASRAAKWLPFAITVPPDEAGRQEHSLTLPLSMIARLDPQETGVKARAAFLEVEHGISSGGPEEKVKSLANDIRKAANNVSESVRRAINFFKALIPEEELPDSTLWPAPPKLPGLDRGVRLYRDLRKAHLREGVLDPADHVSTITERVAREHAERGRLAGSYGGYNLMVRNLRQMLSDGTLPGVPSSLADGLSELRLKHDVGAPWIMPLDDLVVRWPDHFRLSSDGHIDNEYGILGFFNREMGLRRPPAPGGAICPPENLLGQRARESRLGCLRRFLARVATPADHDLRDCFTNERVWQWMTAYIEERGAASSMHFLAWLSIRYTARLYFGIDTATVDRLVEEGMEFPDSGSSLKGTNTLQRAGADPVAAIRAHVAALRHSAETSQRPGPNRRSSLYFPRKSAEIEFWLRILTGLRPSNVAEIVVLDAPTPDTTVPAIWRDGTAFVVCIPYRCMKQNKRKSKGRPIVSRSARVERPYVFRIEYPSAVSALNEYLIDGWCHAVAVNEGRTSSLLINAKGEAFRNFETSQRKTRKRAANLCAGGGDAPADFDRYATRHIMSELLRGYMPGGRLATLYLTHRSETNADRHYGSDDTTFLRQCIHEILDGRPPLPEQQRQNAEKMRQQEYERHRLVENMGRQLTETNGEMKKVAAALAAKDEEILMLRGKLAEERRERRKSPRASA